MVTSSTHSEKLSWSVCVLPIALIFSFRMLGLFMLIPVFTIYAPQLTDATPRLIGLALGSYGLSQGLLQLPFGMLSDFYGRKRMITIGLILFSIGSLLGGIAHSIYGIIIARILQGAGAIGSVLIALLSDLTLDNQRTKAMAVIGASIGLSFSVALFISPAIATHFGLSGIFFLTSLLAVIALVLLYRVIPNASLPAFQDNIHQKQVFRKIITDPQLLRLNIGIFCQHLILTATFFVLPLILQQQIQAGDLTQSWHFYLPIVLGSFLSMLPLMIWVEKKKFTQQGVQSAILLTALSQVGLVIYNQHFACLCLLMFIYFIAFNFLEATLPSLISRQAPPNTKGTAMGIYSSFQFLGIFAGGTLAGAMYSVSGTNGLFALNFFVSGIWLLLTFEGLAHWSTSKINK